MAKGNSASSSGLLDSLRQSPATKHLLEQARGMGAAHADRLSDSLTGRLSAIAESVGGGGAKLPLVGEGAKRMLQGKGAVGSVVGAATSKVADTAKNVVGGNGNSNGGRSGKSTNIEESIDVGVPVSVAYNQWTQFQTFSDFMKGVESVEQVSDTETNWRVKIFKSRRTWKATIQEQVPDHRIVWTSEGGKGSTKGVVTFHQLGEDLTRVLVTIEYFPSGLMERTGNLWRAAGRRTRLDLKNFRRFVMMQGEETGAWRGEIHKSRVTKSPGRKAPARKEAAPARKGAGRKANVRKSTAREAPARKQAARKAPARKAPASKAAARKAPTRKAAARKAPTRKAPARKAPARKQGSGRRSSSPRT